MPSVISAARQIAALDETSPPRQNIRLIIVDWLKDDAESHSNVADFQLAWEEWGVVAKRVNERTYGKWKRGNWAKQSPYDVFSDWLVEEDGEMDDGGEEVEESMVREKLLVFCYFGHGYVKVVDGVEHLFALSGDRKTNFDLTKLQECARDTISHCDILFYLDCCESDVDGMTSVEKLRSYERVNASIKLETLTAGVGDILGMVEVRILRGVSPRI